MPDKRKHKKEKDFFLEIGVEELPVVCIEIVYEELEGRLKEILAEKRLACGKISVEATPRRILVSVKKMSGIQQTLETEVVGPPEAAAFDKEGNATKALEGFLAKRKLKKEDVFIKETPRGNYVACKVVEKGLPAKKVLPEVVAELLGKLPFPKFMKWEDSGFLFPRPIRWIAALYGKEKVKFEIADVSSSDHSFGHRFLNPRKFRISSPDLKKFSSRLKKKHVLISREEREDKIRKFLSKKMPAKYIDEELVSEAASLVEEPFPVTGKLEKSFLELPPEVLSTSMKKNQKTFACVDSKGKLKGEFVGIINGRRKNVSRIALNYENVIEARLRDARFFFKEDTSTKLEAKVDKLKDLVFLGKLGNVYEKTERMIRLSDWLGEKVGLSNEEKEKLKRAAYLSKADLVTRMVYEFPELQGIIGREYAKVDGEDTEVAEAISDHYLPKSLVVNDPLKLSDICVHGKGFKDARTQKERVLGALLGIVDRIDVLVGAFGTGVELTGSQDPFALRRAASGIVKIVQDFRSLGKTPISFLLDELVGLSYELYLNKLKLEKERILEKISRVIKERVIYLLAGDDQKKKEIMHGVINSSVLNICEISEKFEQLYGLSRSAKGKFEKACKVVERTSNILKGLDEKQTPPLEPGLFKEDLEKKLFTVLNKNRAKFNDLVNEGQFGKATVFYADTFSKIIHDFFDKVLVNVEDMRLRGNRQALIREVNRLYSASVADLSSVNLPKSD